MFQDDRSVRNDVRFLEIWLKYAAMSSKPLEVFDFMYSEGLCTHLSEMFTTWAWYLECSQAYKKAEAVFSKGMDAMVEREMKDRLLTRQQQFRERVRRRLNGEEIPDEEVEDEKRSALGQLRAHGKKSKVSSLRVGAEKMGGPGVLSAVAQPVKHPLKTSNQQGGNKFKIFTDSETSSSGQAARAGGSGGASRVPCRSDQKENQMTAGSWTKAKIVKKSQNVPLDSISQYSQPAFTVYEEPNIVQPSQTSQRSLMPAETNVLATNKGEKKHDLHCPIALFEPPDPTKAVMYCKDRVYQGTTEFSFEELRALRYREKLRQQEETEMMDRRKAELLEMEQKLKERQEEMDRQMAELKKMMSQQKEKVERPSLSSEEETSLSRLSRNPSLDSTAALLAANPNPSGCLATPSPSRSGITQPSPTINTREALDVMQKLWSKPIGEEDREPAPIVYSDHNPEVERVEPLPAQPFAIFCDENAAPRRQMPLNRRSRIEMINDNDKENFLMPGENRENQPPVGYSQPPTEVRTKTGILTEADNVEFLPLEEQEKLLDQEEQQQQQEIPIFVDRQPEPIKKSTMPRPFAGNHTILLPNEEDFGDMAKLSSTPFNGRPSHHDYEQDENTCAVDILYKMAPPPPPAEEGPGGLRLDTIVETSREYYKSSSSSSGGETLQHNTNRSHWGNTGHTIHAGHCQTASIATPGQHLVAQGCVTNSSGYLGDHSRTNNITKSEVKDKKRELIASPQVTSYDKKMKMFDTPEGTVENDEVFDEEPTGLFSDMMAELKQGKAQFQTDLETTAQSSFLNLTRVPSRLELPQSPRLEVTGLEQFNLTSVPRLELTESTEPRVDLTLGVNRTGVLAVSPPPVLELTDNMDDLSLDETQDQSDLDPFHPDTHRLWLSKLSRPVMSLHGYINSSSTKMPSIRSKATVQLGGDVFLVRDCKGEGGYAKVFAASRQDSDDLDSTIAGDGL